ncbi:FecR family protein [Chitinophaga sp. 22321]|uniref:FecR domain-containing protein n=1 Tax=Chitinophaga hostae TaxID=2831022 RepID=A0ABS5IWI0_9BACT|nr:FecR domain-containing protein [Chitinophaga hostae]MBS0027322.1 FecR domain-containing protein [Chitinophaga hostae]
MTSDKQHTDQLMLEKLTGMISPEDDHTLRRLMAADPALKDAFSRMQEQLHTPAAKQYLRQLDETQLWEKRKHLFQKGNIRHMRVLYRGAAAGLLLLLGSALYLFLSREQQPHPLAGVKPAATANNVILQMANGQTIVLSDTAQSALLNIGAAQMRVSPKSLQYESADANAPMAMNLLQVPAGKDYKLTLPDSTEIWLNAMSEIRFPVSFNGPTREVFVNGEAYFSVSKDINRPFIVHTGQFSVNVLGTAFNINTYSSNSPRLSLSSGKVALKSKTGNQSVQLSPGYEATYNSQQNNGFRVDAFNARNTLAWMEGKYYFRNTTLKEIAMVIRRLFDVTVQFNTAGVENMNVSGVLTKKDGLPEFMDNLSKTTDIKYQLNGSVLQIL